MLFVRQKTENSSKIFYPTSQIEAFNHLLLVGRLQGNAQIRIIRPQLHVSTFLLRLFRDLFGGFVQIVCETPDFLLQIHDSAFVEFNEWRGRDVVQLKIRREVLGSIATLSHPLGHSPLCCSKPWWFAQLFFPPFLSPSRGHCHCVEHSSTVGWM